MSVNSKMTAIANAIRSLLGISGTLGLDAMATRLSSITKKTAQTYTPGTTGQTIAAGQYLAGAQTIAGDANLVPENIVQGKSIFGKAGTAEPAAALADELAEQDSLIGQIMTALEGKTAGGTEICTVAVMLSCSGNTVTFRYTKNGELQTEQRAALYYEYMMFEADKGTIFTFTGAANESGGVMYHSVTGGTLISSSSQYAVFTIEDDAVTGSF